MTVAEELRALADKLVDEVGPGITRVSAAILLNEHAARVEAIAHRVAALKYSLDAYEADDGEIDRIAAELAPEKE